MPDPSGDDGYDELFISLGGLMFILVIFPRYSNSKEANKEILSIPNNIHHFSLDKYYLFLKVLGVVLFMMFHKEGI